jgi:hypothetical protein
MLAEAQDAEPMERTEDSRYFDFWEGDWHRVIDGRVDTSATRFEVRRGVHPAAFEEVWRLRVDSTTVLRARAFRAWDKTSGRWMFVWVSDNGLFQVWEGRKVGAHWYIYREFGEGSDRFLSRQAWISVGRDRVVRTIERSNDGGASWLLRVREVFVRIDGTRPRDN